MSVGCLGVQEDPYDLASWFQGQQCKLGHYELHKQQFW